MKVRVDSGNASYYLVLNLFPSIFHVEEWSNL